MLGEAMSSLLEPLRRVAESRFEASVKSRETRNCFPIKNSYCCDITEAENMSAARQNAGRQHPSVRRHSMYENMVMGRLTSIRVVVETMEARRRIKNARENWKPGGERL